MISSILSHISALVLFAAGLVLLFASDTVLPAILPGFPATGAWLGQLLAAAWLGVAASTWLQRRAVLGGIYGRPTVLANLALYFISALSLIRAVLGHGAPTVLWFAVAVTGVLAVAYGALLLHGPFGAAERSAP
ncbi:MAG TPA: hypothetical protein VFY94_07610 [Rhodanobacteraceae bacterium]|jgi:hypothetical protein|nr:hypothetical protein [Rhodanobacteraceae bacterium]